MMNKNRSIRARAALATAAFAGFAGAATWLGVTVDAQSAPNRDRLLVRSGDRITISVTIGAVQVFGTGIASGSGQLGDTVRVLPAEGRKALTAKITGPGTVEVRP
jgi:flagella basal body P-ring formation protein FlgA